MGIVFVNSNCSDFIALFVFLHFLILTAEKINIINVFTLHKSFLINVTDQVRSYYDLLYYFSVGFVSLCSCLWFLQPGILKRADTVLPEILQHIAECFRNYTSEFH